MKRLFVISILMNIVCLALGQVGQMDSSRINLPAQYNPHDLQRQAERFYPIYDTMQVMATIQDRDSVVKTEPCILRLKAKKVIVMENLGQWNNFYVKGEKLVGRFIIIPDWKIDKLIRKRNNKSLYKGRILIIKQFNEK